jgi:hypothetical protein
MTTLASRLSSPRFVRKLTWLSGLVFVAGVIAFAVAYFGDTADKVDVRAATNEPAPIKERPTVPLDKAARQVAGRFVVTAVTRDDVKAAWNLTHPELKSAVTRKQWFNGELPVPVYPASAIDAATFKVDVSYRNEVVLDLLILPKKGSGYRPQAFFVSLKAVGTGKDKRWLVTSFLPHGGPSTAVPNIGQ